MERDTRIFLASIMLIILGTVGFTSLLYFASNNATQPNTETGGQVHTISKTYLGTTVEKEYLPLLILYDPYGDKSYQRTPSNTSASFKLLMAGQNGIEVNGSVMECVAGGFSSSLLSDPENVGPGSGDAIIGSIRNLTWEVYWYNDTNLQTKTSSVSYHLELISSVSLGGFSLSRHSLASESNTSIEDETGQSANCTSGYEIGAGLSLDHYYEYSWSGAIRTGFSYKVHFSGLTFSITYSIVCPETETIHVEAHYEDSSQPIGFYEAADNAIPGLDEVHSYALWFNPQDITSPVISSPPDQYYLLGTTSGHNITWNGSDQHPWQYKVDEQYQGHINTVAFGGWHNESIVHTLGDLSAGKYVYTCTLRDGEGNTISDSVNVTVAYPHSITREYLGFVGQRVYIPVMVLYDPYGDKSYQKTLISTNAQFTLWMEGENGVEVNRTFPTGIGGSFSSSMSSSPDDMGPGIGDSIITYV